MEVHEATIGLTRHHELPGESTGDQAVFEITVTRWTAQKSKQAAEPSFKQSAVRYWASKLVEH